MQPFTVTVPHKLSRQEMRERMDRGVAKLPDSIPLGKATVDATWPTDDRMALVIGVMGQQINATVDVSDTDLAITMMLPASLGFIKPMIEATIRSKAGKLTGS